jgi:tetraprenyl-beta-curcumene synthase
LQLALDPAGEQPNYYAHHPRDKDGGYLCDLVQRCRARFSTFPSADAVRAPLLLAVRRMGTFQSLNHDPCPSSRDLLVRWASLQTDLPCNDLRWWESAAATASSLTAFALIAASSHTGLQAGVAWSIHQAYFPWIGALHVLLDSLLDREDDLAAEQHSLVDHYSSAQEAAQRIGAIASEAVHRSQALPDGTRHHMILAAMASFYLSAASDSSPLTQLVRPRVLDAMGELARPTMMIMTARRKAAGLTSLEGLRGAHG